MRLSETQVTLNHSKNELELYQPKVVDRRKMSKKQKTDAN